MEYIGRRSVSDLTGEKLAEEHVLDSVPAELSEFGLAEANYTVCGVQATGSEDRPKYVLVVETAAKQPNEVLARRLDDCLKKLNSRYELKRNFGDLHPLEIRWVRPQTFSQYRRQKIEEGLPAGQFKDKILHPDGAEVLAGLLGLSASVEKAGVPIEG